MNTDNFSSLEEANEHFRDLYQADDGFNSLVHEYNDAAYNSVEAIETDDQIIIGCLKHDSDASDFWENDESAGELTLFRSKDHYESIMKDLKKSKKLFYLVDKYEHGNVHYSVASSSSYPDQQWDVSSGCGVFIPCQDVQDSYKKIKRKEGESEAFTYFVKDSNSVLDEYSKWCNGEVYGYSVVVYDKQGMVLEEDECWGFIGEEYANQEKLSVMQNYVESYQLDKLKENVIIEQKDAGDSKKLPFNIDDENLESFQYVHLYDKHIVAAKYKTENKAIVYQFTEGGKKPIVTHFEEWQLKHGVSPEQFLNGRLNSDIKEILKHHLNLEKEQHNIKNSVKL